jgi:hypothetical protein
VLVTAGFFCLSTLFYKDDQDSFRLDREAFFVDLEAPVIADAQQDGYDRQQRSKLGVMVSIMGAGVFLMILIPNPLWGKLMYLCSAAVICGIGLLLVRSARHDQKAN